MRQVAVVILFLIAATQSANAGPFCALFGIGCPVVGAPPPFVPTYEQNVQLLSPFHGPTSLNEWYFAKQSSAEKTCELLKAQGCQSVFARPQCSMGGGSYSCTAVERELVFVDFNRNAGIYASYWTRNPEDLYPGLALKMARMQLAAERSGAKRLAKARMRALAKSK